MIKLYSDLKNYLNLKKQKEFEEVFLLKVNISLSI